MRSILKTNNVVHFVSAPIILGVVLTIFASPGLISQTKANRTKKAEKATVNDDAGKPPVTLQDTLDLIKAVRTHQFPKASFDRKLATRKVDFEKSPANIKLIEDAASGDQSLIQIVLAVAKDYVAPLPILANGRITVNCAPAECEVSLPGKKVSTKDGKAVFQEVKPGPYKLEFSKTDYRTQQVIVNVEAGKEKVVPVTLEMTEQAKLSLASALWEKVWKAHAAGANGTGAQNLDASGTATIYDVDGKSANWNVHVKFLANYALLDLSTLTGKPLLRLECVNEPCVQPPQKKSPFGSSKSGLDVEDIAAKFQQFRNNHLGRMLFRLAPQASTLISASQELSGFCRFVLESKTEIYEVLADSSFLITEITVKSKLGLGDGFHIIYTDYARLGPETVRYPKKTQYATKGGKQGAEFQLNWPEVNR